MMRKEFCLVMRSQEFTTSRNGPRIETRWAPTLNCEVPWPFQVRQNIVLRRPFGHYHREVLLWIDAICGRSHHQDGAPVVSYKELSYLDPPVERVRLVEPAPRIIRRRKNFRGRLLGERDVSYNPNTIP